ncbi:MAG: HAD-IIIA family hydrolase [Bacteroidales bacterium]|nr:HAD-IIIA family hydrolase [Bacteroidales bacterium]
MKNYKEKLAQITTLIFDYDGVMTDACVWALPSGEMLRRSNVRDGYALQLAVKMGYHVVVLSGGRGEGIERRLETLHIPHIYTGVCDKVATFQEFLTSFKISPEECLFMGDDIPDFPVMQLVALACCPADAVQEIKDAAHYISHQKGGEGCVRDVIEQVMKAQGRWMMDRDAHLW